MHGKCDRSRISRTFDLKINLKPFTAEVGKKKLRIIVRRYLKLQNCIDALNCIKKKSKKGFRKENDSF